MTQTQNLTLSQAMQFALQHYQQGDWASAEELYHQVLKFQPTNAEALNWLGICRAQQGDAEQALDYVQQAVQHAPKDADYQNNLGNLYLQQDSFAEAQQCFQKALKLKPKFATAHLNLGVAFKQQDDLENAAKALRKAVKLSPQYAKAWYTLGTVYLSQKQLPVAYNALKKALNIEPNNADALNAMGGWYKAKGEVQRASDFYQKALKIRPDFAEIYVNLGMLWEQEKQYEDAIQAYQKSLEIEPDAKVAFNIGFILQDRSMYFKEAETYLKQAIELDENYAQPYVGLANLKLRQANIQEALEYYRKMQVIDPDYQLGWINYLFAYNYIAETRKTSLPELQHLHENYPAIRFPQKEKQQRCTNAQRRLRIGYVSDDFRDHSVAYFMQTILAQHDATQFEIFCYQCHKETDDMSTHLESLVEHFYDLSKNENKESIKQIRQNKIDILVDLSGYTSENLLSFFSQKLAPLQIEYLGYPNTLGVSFMDYRLVDTHTEPPEYAQQHSSEQLLYLPNSYFCYQPPSIVENLSVSPPPVLKNGFITFGSFNNPAKVSDKTIQYWSAILQQVAGSRLLLKSKAFAEADIQQLFTARFTQHGIAAERLMFKDAVEKREHFAVYQEIDIALDTYPYNGATTTCEALWMGVPVLSLSGETHPSRMGLSILSCVGLSDLVSNEPEIFIQKTVDLAQDVSRLQTLHHSIREQMQHSPLMQAAPFTRYLETLYQQVWADYCSTD